jgi:hypothetical protein
MPESSPALARSHTQVHLIAFQKENPTFNIAVAAVSFLTGVVGKSSNTTIRGLQEELKAEADKLIKSGVALSISELSITAACDLFNRFSLL